MGGAGDGRGGERWEVGGGRGTHFAVEFHRADCNFASSLKGRWGVMVTNRATPEEAGSVLQVAVQSRGLMGADRCGRSCVLTSAAGRSPVTLTCYVLRLLDSLISVSKYRV